MHHIFFILEFGNCGKWLGHQKAREDIQFMEVMLRYKIAEISQLLRNDFLDTTCCLLLS